MQNVSSIIKVSFGKSLSSSINYVAKGKPKNNDNGNIKSRVLAINSENLFDNNIKLDYKMMRHNLYASHFKNKKVHCIRIINSFNFKDLKKLPLAQRLNSRLIRKAFGNNVQCLSVWQRDGTHHFIHCHNILTNADFKGNSLTHRSRFYRIMKINSSIIRSAGFKPVKFHNKYNHIVDNRRVSKSVGKLFSYRQFKPVVHLPNGRIYFPKILHGKNIISILKNSANRLKFPKDYTIAQDYLKRSDSKEDVKAVKLQLIDEKIDDVKMKIAKKNEVRRMRIIEIKRERGLYR